MDAGKPSQLLGPFVPGASLGKADVRFKGLVATLTEAQLTKSNTKKPQTRVYVFCLGNCKFGMIPYEV